MVVDRQTKTVLRQPLLVFDPGRFQYRPLEEDQGVELLYTGARARSTTNEP